MSDDVTFDVRIDDVTTSPSCIYYYAVCRVYVITPSSKQPALKQPRHPRRTRPALMDRVGRGTKQEYSRDTLAIDNAMNL